MVKSNLKKYAKRAAIVAALGVTGLVCLGVVNLYRFSKDMNLLDLDGENWWK